MKANETIATKFKESGPIEIKELAFHAVWAHQVKLMKAYKEAGRLSEWPVSIQPRENQKFYRELFGFLEEEIIEASVEVENLLQACNRNDSDHILEEILISLNEEIADSLHFWVELFIYLGYDPLDFKEYYAQLAINTRLNSEVGEILHLAFQHAENWIRYNTHNVRKGENTFFIKMEDLTPYTQAGRIISKEIIADYERYTFSSIRNLQLAKNCLKSKYWKTQDSQVNIEKFNELIMEAWLNWVVSVSILDLRPAALVQNYMLKNQINHSRLITQK